MTPTWFARFEKFPFAVDVTDSNNCFVYVNSAFERLYGYRRSEILGLLPHFLVPDSVDRQMLKEAMRRVVDRKKAWMGLQPNLTSSGQTLEVFLIALPIRDLGGVGACYIYFASLESEWRELVLAVLDLMGEKFFDGGALGEVAGPLPRTLPRQEAILGYYRLGYTAKQIASIMGIAASTVRSVKSHLASGRRGRTPPPKSTR
jgi:PAS domain S-box-containing protein